MDSQKAKATNKQSGDEGEAMAASFLSRMGYKIEAKNLLLGKAEIDLVCTKGDMLILVEVKLRKSNYFGYPETTLSARKIELYHQAAIVLQEQYAEYKRFRMDIIAIEYKNQMPIISHFPDSF